MSIPVWERLIYVGTPVAVAGTALVILGITALVAGNESVCEWLFIRSGLPVLGVACVLLTIGLFGWWSVAFIVLLVAFWWVVRSSAVARRLR